MGQYGMASRVHDHNFPPLLSQQPAFIVPFVQYTKIAKYHNQIQQYKQAYLRDLPIFRTARKKNACGSTNGPTSHLRKWVVTFIHSWFANHCTYCVMRTDSQVYHVVQSTVLFFVNAKGMRPFCAAHGKLASKHAMVKESQREVSALPHRNSKVHLQRSIALQRDEVLKLVIENQEKNWKFLGIKKSQNQDYLEQLF